MTKTAVSVWDECLSFIKDNIKPQAYKTWFAQCRFALVSSTICLPWARPIFPWKLMNAYSQKSLG